MTLVTPADSAWSAGITTTADTIFQCLAGSAVLGFGVAAPVAANDGLHLHANPSVEGLGMQHITIPAGQTVYWRSAVPRKPCLLYYQAFPAPGP